MDFAGNEFAKNMARSPNDEVGSDSKTDGSEGSAEQIAASAPPKSRSALDANKADASQGPMKGPVTGEVIGPDMDREAGLSARGGGDTVGAKGRQGSSLVIIPPVTRSADESLGGAHFSAKRADFGAERASRPERSAFSAKGWGRYAAPVALGFCLFGLGLATGGRLFGGMAPARPAGQTAGGAAVQLADGDGAAMQRLDKKLEGEIHALQSRVEALRVAIRSGTPEDVSGVKKGLDALKASFETAEAQTNASIAQVTARLDRLQHREAGAEKPSGRVSQAENSAGVPATPGLNAKSAAAKATATKSAATMSAAPRGSTMVAATSAPSALPRDEARPSGFATEAKKRPHLLEDWVVRDVYEGVALVEGPQGAIEVMRGESIPGAGRVEAIERKNGRWIVVTSRGVVRSSRD